MAQKKKPWPIGLKIKEVRWVTPKEMKALGWYGDGVILILEDGGFILPSSDPEGNNIGALMGAHGGNPLDLLYPPKS